MPTGASSAPASAYAPLGGAVLIAVFSGHGEPFGDQNRTILSLQVLSGCNYGSNQTKFAPVAVRRANHWRACTSLSRRDLPQHHLAHPPRQHDKLGGGHAWHRALGGVFKVGSLAAAAPARRSPWHRLLNFCGATLSLFQCLAGTGTLD